MLLRHTVYIFHYGISIVFIIIPIVFIIHYILLMTSEISAQKLSTSILSLFNANTLASSVGSSSNDIIPAIII